LVSTERLAPCAAEAVVRPRLQSSNRYDVVTRSRLRGRMPPRIARSSRKRWGRTRYSASAVHAAVCSWRTRGPMAHACSESRPPLHRAQASRLGRARAVVAPVALKMRSTEGSPSVHKALRAWGSANQPSPHGTSRYGDLQATDGTVRAPRGPRHLSAGRRRASRTLPALRQHGPAADSAWAVVCWPHGPHGGHHPAAGCADRRTQVTQQHRAAQEHRAVIGAQAAPRRSSVSLR
jgi:hypothetical protein